MSLRIMSRSDGFCGITLNWGKYSCRGSEPPGVLVGGRLATHLTGGEFDLRGQRVRDPKEQISSSVSSRSVPELSNEEVSTANPYSWAIHALPVAPR